MWEFLSALSIRTPHSALRTPHCGTVHYSFIIWLLLRGDERTTVIVHVRDDYVKPKLIEAGV